MRIDQDPAASDPTADVLDIEAGAATPASAPGWATRALASRASQARPGQRAPAVYMSQSRVTEVVNALIAGGISSGAEDGAATILTRSIRAAPRGPFRLAPGLLRRQFQKLIASDLGRLKDLVEAEIPHSGHPASEARYHSSRSSRRWGRQNVRCDTGNARTYRQATWRLVACWPLGLPSWGIRPVSPAWSRRCLW